jgi:hypothetical protein
MTVHVTVTAPMLAAYDYFLAVGFTKNGAAAPVGNGCQESGEFLVATMFRAHPDWSGGVPEALKSGGFEEWLGDRKTACIAFIGRAEQRLGVTKGSLLNDLGTQCAFVVYELQTNERYATLYQQLTTGSRSIANLTANFMAIYEVPALKTANLDNRIEHAEAVAVRAAEIKATTAPPAAPPVHVPEVPRPQLPATPAKPPTAPAVPISASTAGRQSAILDNLGAMLDALLKERSAINSEIAIINKTSEDFGKLPGVSIALPQPLQIQAADQATQPQGKQTVFGITNWKTTLGGLAAILTAAGTGIHAFQSGDLSAAYESLPAILAGLALIGAKDNNVTGGSVPQTNEAKTRATSQPITHH